MEKADHNSLKLPHFPSTSKLLEFEERWALEEYDLEKGMVLRKRLVYNSLEQLQSEMVALYNGPGAIESMKKSDFEVLRKYICRICSNFAIGAQKCSCGKIICSECCEKKLLVSSQGQGKKEIFVPKPHREHGPDFEDRKICQGPLSSLCVDDYNEWRACMVFKCVYGCNMNCIPYELLENHIVYDCPMRPMVC